MLEPLEACDVEVVRRLVQEQEIRVAAEGARERGARQLAARERVEPPVEVGVREAEPAHDGGRPVAPAVATRVLEARLRVRVARQGRLVVRAARHRLLEPAELLLERHEVGSARDDVLAERQAALEGRALVVERDARGLCEHELAGVDRGLAGDHPQERRLAGAVRPRESDAVSPAHDERDALEEDGRAEVLAQVGGGDDGHVTSSHGRGA